MADLNPAVILSGYTPQTLRAASDQSDLSQSSNALLQLQGKEAQQKIDEQKYQLNARKTINDILEDMVKRRTGAASGSTAPVDKTDDNGEAVGGMRAPDARSVTGRPTLATPEGVDPQAAGMPGENPAAVGGIPGGAARGGITPIPGVPQQAGPSPDAAPAGHTPPAQPAAAPPAARRPGSGGFFDDADYFRTEMARRGLGHEALAMNPSLMAATKTALDIEKAQAEQIAEKHSRLGSLAAGVLRNQVDMNEPDPQKLDAQKKMFLSSMTSALQTGIEQGLIDQAHAAPIAEMIQNGDIPHLQQQASLLVDAAKDSVALHGSVANFYKAQRDAVLFGPEQAEKMSKAKKEALAVTSQTVRAIEPSITGFAEFFNRQPKEVQEEIKPVYDQVRRGGDIAEAIETIATMGETEAQRDADSARGQTRQDRLAQQDFMNDFRKEQAESNKFFKQAMLAIAQSREQDRSEDRKKETKADLAESNRLQDREAVIARDYEAIGAQLQRAREGKAFYRVGDDGKTRGALVKPPAEGWFKGNSEDDLVSDPAYGAARTELENRFKALNDERTDIVRRKNDILVRNGHEPWKPTEQPKKKADAPKATVTPTVQMPGAPANPAAAPIASPAAKPAAPVARPVAQAAPVSAPLKAYADRYFGGDVKKAQEAIDNSTKGR